jgi:hypothetical protein
MAIASKLAPTGIGSFCGSEPARDSDVTDQRNTGTQLLDEQFQGFFSAWDRLVSHQKSNSSATK